jgi:hypothetical protein
VDRSPWTEVCGQKSVNGSPTTKVKSATHHHCRRPRCCKALVSSVAMADGNAALRDVASSRRRCVTLQARGGAAARVAAACVVASLRRCDGVATMAGQTDRLLCRDGESGQ